MTYPPGYPPDSTPDRQTPSNTPDSPASAPTKDPRPSGRVSGRQLESIASRLSDRDQAIIATVSRFRVASGEQLQRLYWTEGSAQTRARLARHGLTRLVNLGVLAVLERHIGGVRSGSAGRVFALGLAGQRLHLPATGRRVRSPHTPGDRHLAHTLAIAGLYVRLTEQARSGQLDLLTFETEPSCWRTYLGPWGSRLILKPDAFVKVGAGDFAYSWFIEIDMATESLATIHHKLNRHSDYHHSGSELRAHGVAPRVAWIVPTQKRKAAIEQAIAQLPPDSRKLFAVATTTDALDLLQTGVWS